MKLNSIIKKFGFVLLLVWCHVLWSQNETNSDNKASQKLNKKQLNKRAIAIGLDVYKPIPTGQNFFAESSDGKLGFTINAQLFIYDHIFIGGAFGDAYFDNKSIAPSGNYTKTTINSNEILIGYEYPVGDFRFGLSVSIVGNARFKNILSSSREVYQVDHSSFRNYSAIVNYQIDNAFYVYLNYTFRNDKTDIKTSPEILNNFNTINSHNIGLGIRFYFGEKAIID